MIEETRISAYAIIIEDGRMLLCRISKQSPENAGQWTLPGGGIDFGEHPERAVVRELEEETGYQVEVGSLLKVDSELFEFPDVRKHIIRLMYRAKIVGGSIRHEAEGSTDLAAWHCVADLSELDLVPTAQAGAEFARP